LPLPDAPPVIVSHDAPLDAFQVQPAGAVTPTVLPDVAPAATDAPVGEIENVQGIPDCVTVNVCPATVIDPERLSVLEFAAKL
jgi:hypothetical protein